MKQLTFLLFFLTLTGCTHSKTVYVPESEKVELITHNGIEGYFVPKSKMTQLAEEHIKYNYYLKKYGPIN